MLLPLFVNHNYHILTCILRNPPLHLQIIFSPGLNFLLLENHPIHTLHDLAFTMLSRENHHVLP